MSRYFPDFTDKMEYLFMDIIASLGQLPIEVRDNLFCLNGEDDMECVVGFAGYITMEYIKYAFDYCDPEFPLSHFYKQIEDSDSERMLQSRTMKYALKYKKREIERSGIDIPSDHKFADVSMNSIEKRLQGHRLTEMNFFEQQNIHNMDIIKAIVENRISYSKKVSNSRFEEMFSQYDSFVEELIENSKKSDKDMVFCSIAFFTFEWHYPVEMLYYIASVMEEENIDNIEAPYLRLLCNDISVQSNFGGGWFSGPSRMVKERFKFFDDMFSGKNDLYAREKAVFLMKELFVLGVQCKELLQCEDGRKYIDWFRTESDESDWASFLRYYDIFSIWRKKQWTPKKIQNMRKLFRLISEDKI